MFQSALDFLSKDNSKTLFIKIPKEQLSDEYIRIFENGKEKKLKKIDGSRILGNLAPFTLNPIQTAFFEYYKGESTIISTPTGTGKTISFYYALFYKGIKKTIYISPTRALANQIYKELKEKTSLNIVLKTGEYDTFIPKNYDVVVCTAESFVSACRNKNNWVEEAKLIVFDEIHVITHELRSLAYEEALIYAKEMKKSLLLLSATIPGMEELVDWLDISLVIQSDWRPIPLERRFYEIVTPNQNNIGEFVDLLLEEILYQNLKNNYKTILVVPSKKIGWLILEELEKRGFKALNETVPFAKRIEGEIRTAFHNADIPKEERELIEEMFKDRNSKLTLLIATQTLAMGFNSPADDVIIIVKNIKGYLFPNILDLLQFEGRAGRMGFTKKGKGTVHYIVGKGKKTKELLKKELESWKSKEFSTILERNYKFLFKVLENKLKSLTDLVHLEIEDEFSVKIIDSINNISLIFLGIMSKGFDLIKNSFFFHKIKSNEKLVKMFVELNNVIIQILKERGLIKGKRLSVEGKLLSSFYIHPTNYFLFKKSVQKFKEVFEDDFWNLWNNLPILLDGNYEIPDFYPNYWENELYEEIIPFRRCQGLLLYGIGYFGEFINLEIKEGKDELFYLIQKVKPPVWVMNLTIDIPRIIYFLKKALKLKIIDLNISEEELKRIELSFIYGIHPNFSLLAQVKKIGYVRAYLLRELALTLGLKNEKELKSKIEEIKNNELVIESVIENLKEKYLKKLRYIIKEKFNTEFVSEKVMEQLNYFLNNERKELIKALELLEKYG
jgi:helicase